MSLNTTPVAGPGGPRPLGDATPLEALFRGRREAAAAVLGLLLEVVPIVGLLVAFREGAGVWIVLTSVLAAGALIPPIAVGLGQRWGYALGQYIVWGSLGGIVLRALH
ncbi:MAG TPA: hypothetical protein VG457_18025, partial [Planctomycetota bacterium]|nr:hypothetical protein [Planctomycetota bacterium]